MFEKKKKAKQASKRFDHQSFATNQVSDLAATTSQTKKFDFLSDIIALKPEATSKRKTRSKPTTSQPKKPKKAKNDRTNSSLSNHTLITNINNNGLPVVEQNRIAESNVDKKKSVGNVYLSIFN